MTICTTKGRQAIKSLFKRETEDLRNETDSQAQDIQDIKEDLRELMVSVAALKEATMQQCRNVLVDIYYDYRDVGQIPYYVRETADKTFETYTEKFGGNSYAADIYEEIRKFEVLR